MPNFSLNERRQSVSPKSDWVTVGKIVGVWGIEGLLKVRSLTSVGGRLSVGSVVFIAGNPHKIESERPTKSGLILGLENLNDRTEAETIVGLFLEVPLSYVRPSQIDGNFYHFEIIDSDVTPIAYPIDDLPERPKNKISDEFMIQKMLGLLPAD